MGVNERFKNILSNAEIELACSLPVFDKNKEILFLYSTDEVDENSFKIRRIEHLYSRDYTTGVLSEDSILDYLTNDMRLELEGSIVCPKVFDEEAFDAEEKYYLLYEKFFEMGFKENISTKDKSNLANLVRLFDLIIPESNLKMTYRTIGKEFFSYAQRMLS